jgi:hypothetical protein
MERIWSGRVRPGHESEHEKFVAWLSSADGAAHLSRALLTHYRLAEEDGRLTVSLSAGEPPAIIRFLRNRRFWPDYWEFESADPSAAPGELARVRVSWPADPIAD